MKSALLLVSCVLFYNAFVSEAEVKINPLRQPESPSGPSVHPPLVISVSPKSTAYYMPSAPLEQVFILAKGRKYLFACPAENKASQEMTKNDSQTGYNLFIRTIYQTETEEDLNKEEDEINQVIKETKCSKPVIPTFVHMNEVISKENFKYTVHAIGFEVYIDANIGGVHLIEKEFPFFKPKQKFQWYHVMEILFHPKRLDVKEVIYQMNAYHLDPVFVFTDLVQYYDLGKRELFGSVDIAALYTIDNQNRVFSKLFENETDRMKYFNVAKKKYLVQVHLAPLEVFAKSHIKEAARTYGNLAPMWRVIKENAWKKIEDFLQHVVHAVGPIDVIAGTYETLNIASAGNIFLGKNQVSVPQSFYKIAIFKIHYPEPGDVSILIETINNPYENKKGTLCDENQCEKYGWEGVQNDDYTTGRTICCPVTKHHVELLSIQTDFDPEGGVFDLKNIKVPLKDDSTATAYQHIESMRTSPKPEKNLHRWLTLKQYPPRA